MLGSNFALLVRSPGDDGQQLLTTGSRLVCISLVAHHGTSGSFAMIFIQIQSHTLVGYPVSNCVDLLL